MSAPLVLVSHVLCPYVQRAAIVLAEKGVAFERRDVDLDAKPEWFLAVSPLGKTPVLLAGGQAVFESAVICEYLDETQAPRLHPQDALQRARERGWMEFGTAVLDNIAALYNAPDEARLAQQASQLRERFGRLESALREGPYFRGAGFGLVDAVFAPVFRYLDAFDAIGLPALLDALPKTAAWRAALAQRPSVRDAVAPDYPQRLLHFLRRRPSALGARYAREPAQPLRSLG